MKNQPFRQNKVLLCFYLIFPIVTFPQPGQLLSEFLPSWCSPWIGPLFASSRTSSCFHWTIRHRVCSGCPVNRERLITWRKTMRNHKHFHNKRPKLQSSDNLKTSKFCEFNHNKMFVKKIFIWAEVAVAQPLMSTKDLTFVSNLQYY